VSDTPGAKYHDPVTGEPLTEGQAEALIVEMLTRLVNAAGQASRDGKLGPDAEFAMMMADYRDGLLP